MRTIAKIANEACILGVLGLVLALCANGVRTSGSIDLSRSYYDPFDTRVSCEGSSDFSGQGEESSVQACASEVSPPRDLCPQFVSLHEIAELFQDSNGNQGAYLFVDARDDRDYTEGHIPGAIRADRHQLDRHIEEILVSAEAAEAIVIFCNDGEWGDGRPICCSLEEYGIHHENIFLFDGGWEAWVENDMPVQVGLAG